MWKLPCFMMLITALQLYTPVTHAQVRGCTDPLATNYNAAATLNDGGCVYPAAAVSLSFITYLSDTLKETSGLVYWDGLLWTHNDDTDTLLYGIDTADGHIVRRVAISGAVDNDWEELTQDRDYFYLGDFGNNGNGNRRNLVILRIEKALLASGASSVTPEKIFFSYQDQTDFTATGNNNTDFDCEAFIAGDDSLYLFTKQWVSRKTRLYALPKVPGTYTAAPGAEWNIDGLVTGASYMPGKRTVVLVGYKISTSTFQPFVGLLYDYPGNQLLAGNKRKINLSALLHQTEGIAATDGRRFYITNEQLSNSAITIPAKLTRIDLWPYLDSYYRSLAVSSFRSEDGDMIAYPNPVVGELFVKVKMERPGSAGLKLFNGAGQQVAAATYSLGAGEQEIRFSPDISLPGGIYWLELKTNDERRSLKIVYR